MKFSSNPFITAVLGAIIGALATYFLEDLKFKGDHKLEHDRKVFEKESEILDEKKIR